MNKRSFLVKLAALFAVPMPRLYYAVYFTNPGGLEYLSGHCNSHREAMDWINFSDPSPRFPKPAHRIEPKLLFSEPEY